MNAFCYFTTALFALGLIAVFPAGANEPLPPVEAAKVQPLTNYAQIIAQIPENLRTIRPASWTGLQRNAVNSKLKASFADTLTPVDFSLELKDAGDWWGSLTVLSEIPNGEGYPIAVFGKYSRNWKVKLESLKRGDSIQLKGTVLGITYKEHHGVFTLCIDVESCTAPK